MENMLLPTVLHHLHLIPSQQDQIKYITNVIMKIYPTFQDTQ